MTVERNRLAMNKINKPNIKAPKAAEKVMLNSFKKPDNSPVAIKLKATNKCEPDVRPKTEGPAKGLFNNVCNNKPATAKEAPEINAMVTSGKRKTENKVQDSSFPSVNENQDPSPIG